MVTNQLLSRMILQVQAKSLCKFHGSMAPGVFSYNMVLWANPRYKIQLLLSLFSQIITLGWVCTRYHYPELSIVYP